MECWEEGIGHNFLYFWMFKHVNVLPNRKLKNKFSIIKADLPFWRLGRNPGNSGLKGREERVGEGREGKGEEVKEGMRGEGGGLEGRGGNIAFAFLIKVSFRLKLLLK